MYTQIIEAPSIFNCKCSKQLWFSLFKEGLVGLDGCIEITYMLMDYCTNGLLMCRTSQKQTWRGLRLP